MGRLSARRTQDYLTQGSLQHCSQQPHHRCIDQIDNNCKLKETSLTIQHCADVTSISYSSAQRKVMGCWRTSNLVWAAWAARLKDRVCVQSSQQNFHLLSHFCPAELGTELQSAVQAALALHNHTLHTTYYTLHTAHCTYTTHYTLHTAHCTLHCTEH